jgi:hypothetical protein
LKKLFIWYIANKILLNTGLNQSLVSGNARDTITDIAYSIYDLEISASIECGIMVHVAITFLSSSLIAYDNNIKFCNFVRIKNFKANALKFYSYLYSKKYSKN